MIVDFIRNAWRFFSLGTVVRLRRVAMVTVKGRRSHLTGKMKRWRVNEIPMSRHQPSLFSWQNKMNRLTSTRSFIEKNETEYLSDNKKSYHNLNSEFYGCFWKSKNIFIPFFMLFLFVRNIKVIFLSGPFRFSYKVRYLNGIPLILSGVPIPHLISGWEGKCCNFWLTYKHGKIM